MRTRSWLRWAAIVLLIFLAASSGFSLLVNTRPVRQFLLARLEVAFGRAVEVRSFRISVLGRPRLEANAISVAEDPRFGYEYFLRADRLQASLRWSSLVRGRFEFGTLSFRHPSLNIVRAADGHWNVENWPPSPASMAPAAGSSVSPVAVPGGEKLVARLYRIEVNAGRINFKRGQDKHPLALAEVSGHFEQERSGRWHLDLEARPIRAAVTLQEPGRVRLRGTIAGAATRFEPAELFLNWQGAALADVLRLAKAQDYGVRGRIEIQMLARAARSPVVSGGSMPADVQTDVFSRATRSRSSPGIGGVELLDGRWSFTATAHITRAHRWDLPFRTADPALNLSVEAAWRPGEDRIAFSRFAVEAPRSNLQGSGAIEWSPRFYPRFQFASSGICWADLLAWYRAFRPGVADDLTLNGFAHAALVVEGWPPHVEQGVLTSEGARFQATVLPEPVFVGPFHVSWARDHLLVEPVKISLTPASTVSGAEPPKRPQRRESPQPDLLRFEGSLHAPRPSDDGSGPWVFDAFLEGQTTRAQDTLAVAQAFGYPLNRGWDVEGKAGLALHWSGTFRPHFLQVTGTVDLRDLRLRTTFLNQPVKIAIALVRLTPGRETIELPAAEAFGANWKGTLSRTDSTEPWSFELAADRLEAAELDRWLGPRARPGFIQRLVPFAAPSRASPGFEALIAALRGTGRISVDEFVLSPFRARRLRAEAEVNGRDFWLRRAQADFYGGTLRGSFGAELTAAPVYSFRGQFERVNLASLADAKPTLRDRFAGMASGELVLKARGVGRDALLKSVQGHGTLAAPTAVVRSVDLPASASEGALRPGPGKSGPVRARFAVAAQRIVFEELSLGASPANLVIQGSVSFARELDLRVLGLAPSGAALIPGSRKYLSGASYRLRGSLERPQWTRVTPPLAPE